MNDTRNGMIKAAKTIKGSLIGALGLSILAACSAAPDQGEAVGTAKQAICNNPDGCDPAPTGGGTTYSGPVSHIGATCPDVNPSCTFWGPNALANDTSAPNWTNFQNQLAGLSCRSYSVEFTGGPPGSCLGGYNERRTLCAKSTALTNAINANPGASQDAYACDACVGAPTSGYTWVTWNNNLGCSPNACPGGCGQVTPSGVY